MTSVRSGAVQPSKKKCPGTVFVDQSLSVKQMGLGLPEAFG
jgi:hypothetical protein